MTNTQKMAVGLTFYMVFIAIFTGMFAYIEATTGNDSGVVFSGVPDVYSSETINLTEQPTSTSAVFDSEKFIGVWWSVYGFGWSYYGDDHNIIASYFWIFKLIFIVIPSLLVVLTFYLLLRGI